MNSADFLWVIGAVVMIRVYYVGVKKGWWAA